MRALIKQLQGFSVIPKEHSLLSLEILYIIYMLKSFSLFLRLTGLGFHVEAYHNYKQAEVLDKITKGK